MIRIIEYQRMIQKMILILVLLALLSVANSLEFKSSIGPLKSRCFFEVLDVDQKYKVDIYPLQGSTYSFEISYMDNRTKNWQLEYSRRQIDIAEPLNVHKLAPVPSTYQFCLKNNDANKPLSYEISIASGLELGELHLLPENSDTDNMVLEMEWIQQQTQNLREILGKLNGMRSRAEIVSSLVGNKVIFSVVIFSLAVIVMNGFFYAKIKRTLQARKLI